MILLSHIKLNKLKLIFLKLFIQFIFWYELVNNVIVSDDDDDDDDDDDIIYFVCSKATGDSPGIWPVYLLIKLKFIK